MPSNQLFIINNTEGTVRFFIPPGQVNGPGAVVRNTDLRLHGLGHTMWGEAVDENFYRLTENFACPEKATSPGNPQDESDLGLGNGINNPINGQIWFNTTQRRVFIYDVLLPGWVLVGAVVSGPISPSSPQLGDLWYDTNIPQLNVWTGTSWDSVAERYVLKSGDIMTGFLTLNADPVNPLHAATKQYAVARAGDTMAGILSMGGFKITNLDEPTALGDGVRLEDVVHIAGDSGPIGLHPMTGFLTLNADPQLTFHAATKQYVDTALASVAGGSPILLSGLTFKPTDMVHGVSGPQIYSESNGNEHNTFSYTRIITISSVESRATARDNAPASFTFTTNTSSLTPNVYPVPANVTHVLVRVRFNVNTKEGDGANIGCTFLARQDGSEVFQTKISLDPTGASGGNFEAEDGHTFIIAVTPSNTFQINWVLDTSSSNFRQNDAGSPPPLQTRWDNSVQLYLEGYYILDQTGGMTQAQADLRYVNVPGDTMTGPLAMSGNRINFLGTPTASTDAATKAYVDAVAPNLYNSISGPGPCIPDTFVYQFVTSLGVVTKTSGTLVVMAQIQMLIQDSFQNVDTRLLVDGIERAFGSMNGPQIGANPPDGSEFVRMSIPLFAAITGLTPLSSHTIEIQSRSDVDNSNTLSDVCIDRTHIVAMAF